MRFIILLLIFSFNSFASMKIPVSNIGVCPMTTSYKSKSKCEQIYGEQCVIVDLSYNCETTKPSPEMVNDLDKPIKECEGVDSILEFFGIDENGCKIVGYEKKDSGRKIIAIDENKRVAYDQKMLKRKNREARRAKGKLNRLKCQEALELIGGTFEDQPEATTDQLELDFAEIDKALTKNRRGKALRLITAKAVPPELEELKQELISILEL